MENLYQTDQFENMPLIPKPNSFASQINTEIPTMFCEFCGKPALAEAVLCVHCGKQIGELKAPTPANMNEIICGSWHFGEMFGLVMLTLLFFPFGFYYGYIGLKEPCKGRQGSILLVIAGAITILYFYLFLIAPSSFPPPTHGSI